MNLRNTSALFTAVAALTVAPAIANAQSNDAPSGPPKVIRIMREEIKQGRDAAHEKTETAYVKAAVKYKYPNYTLGMNLISGPTEAWFVEAHDSFKSLENAWSFIDKNAAARAEFASLDALDGELRAGLRTMIAVLNDDLVYRGEEFMKDLPKTRYFMVEMIRVRPYSDRRFVELGKQILNADKMAGVDEKFAVYRVAAGAPGGTYLIFVPMKSMAFMDEMGEREKAMVGAMGTESLQELMKSAAEVIQTSESYLMAINPKMSYVSKGLASQDPDFWMPKAAPAAKPAAKPADKTGAGQ